MYIYVVAQLQVCTHVVARFGRLYVDQREPTLHVYMCTDVLSAYDPPLYVNLRLQVGREVRAHVPLGFNPPTQRHVQISHHSTKFEQINMISSIYKRIATRVKREMGYVKDCSNAPCFFFKCLMSTSRLACDPRRSRMRISPLSHV